MTQKEIITKIEEAINTSATLAGYKTTAEAAIKTFNEAADTNDYKARAKAQKDMDEAIASYASDAKGIVWNTLGEVSDNLLPAILAYDYPVIGYKDEKETVDLPGVENAIITVRKLSEKRQVINLARFDAYAEKKLGKRMSADANAWSMIDELNYWLIKRAANEVGAEMKNAYAYQANTTTGHIKSADVVGASNTKLLATLQRVIDAVLYVENPETKKNKYKATSHDVRYLDRCAASKDRARCTLKGSKYTDMMDVIGNVIFRIATESDYRITYKEQKSK